MDCVGVCVCVRVRVRARACVFAGGRACIVYLFGLFVCVITVDLTLERSLKWNASFRPDSIGLDHTYHF